MRQISAGGAHACAVVGPNRALWCWGTGPDGELGIGFASVQLAPVETGLEDVREVSTGFFYSCAIHGPSRKIKFWGASQYGQLGDGSRFDLGDDPGEEAPGLPFIDF